MMVSQAIKTSEIEGIYLSQKDVMSLIQNNLGLGTKIEPIKDNKAEGTAELIVDVQNTYTENLT